MLTIKREILKVIGDRELDSSSVADELPYRDISNIRSALSTMFQQGIVNRRIVKGVKSRNYAYRVNPGYLKRKL